MGSSLPDRRVPLVLWIVMSLACAEVGARDKTDVIELRNGDHITGEIVQLEYGQVEFKTDDMGTLQIEWDAIRTIRSEYAFDVEQIGGGRAYGLLSTTADGAQVVIGGDTDAARIDKMRVTRIAKLESTFWSRIDGSFSIGYNYAKSTDVTVQSAQFNAAYRGETVDATFNVNTNSSKSPESGTLDRDSIGFNYRWLRQNRNFWAGLVNLERNEELGIDSRLQVGGGLGRYVYQTSQSEISAFAGAALTQEAATGAAAAETDDETSGEGILAASWRIFRLQSPKRSLTSQLVLYPSLTESDRYRGHADATLRYEVIEDFFLDLSFYYDYDSRPPGETVATDDYGVTTSLGYSF